MEVRGYFDESGGFDERSAVFVISGYFILADAAIAMDKAWRDTLARYGLPHFHMVDCAHGRGAFAALDLQRRIAVSSELIALIKEFTFEGYSFVARYGEFDPPDADIDIYNYFADAAIMCFERVLAANRAQGEVAFIFESGHASAGRAYCRLAERLADSRSTVSFEDKATAPLLQAADILAWQTAKYVKDQVSGVRPPRADFLSLMEHPHILFHFSSSNEFLIGIELWPLGRRSPLTSLMTRIADEPVVLFREDGDDTPIMFVDETLGWRPGGNRMVYVAVKDMSGKKQLALAVDEMRLFELVQTLLDATSTYAGSDRFFPIEAESFVPIKKDEQGALMRIQLKNGGHFDVLVRAKEAQE